MKVSETAAQELPLNDERAPVKKNRDVLIATRHLNKRLGTLLEQSKKLDREIQEIQAAVAALE